jgi:kumamolisin
MIRLDGADTPVSGTSAVAPLWAGLVARLNQLLQRQVGYINDFLYSLSGTAAFHDITQGDNSLPAATVKGQALPAVGGYTAGTGWDACTGLGTPNGAELLKAFQPTPSPPTQAPSPGPTPTQTGTPTTSGATTAQSSSAGSPSAGQTNWRGN